MADARKLAVLFDVNVLLDVLQRRQAFYAASAALWAAAEVGTIRGLIAAHGITTLFYLLREHRGAATAHSVMGDMLGIFDVAAVGKREIAHALTLGYSDFEDAVQMAAAIGADADYLATRNRKDFNAGSVTVIEPAALITLLGR